MKKHFILFAIMLITLTIQAQNPDVPKRNCATIPYLEQQKALDPTLETRMNKLEEFTQEWIKNNQDEIDNSKAIITIPVVVHIVYSSGTYNISDSRVQEQIADLNRDYSASNTHSMGAFSPTLKSNTEFQFCLAKRDPNGAATTGIERRTGSGVPSSFSYGTAMKHTSTGGMNQWDPSKYFNIWVCNLTGGLCGFAVFPVNPLGSDYGVVIHYDFFGNTGAQSPYNQGGTSTHEIGHCFNLKHIWGDESGCSGSDNCADTPNQAGENYTCPGVGATVTDACSTTSPGVMYMNFMDYSDDACYTNFTPNQKTRMLALFATGQVLAPLKTSNVCTPVGIEEGNFIQQVTIYPNPTNDEININFNLANATNVDVSIFNLLGKKVYLSEKNNITVFNSIVDLSNQASGVYFVKIKTAKQTLTQKITLVR